jgi:hypothetical protein
LPSGSEVKPAGRVEAISSDLDQVVTEVGNKPEPTTEGFHVCAHRGDCCPIHLGVLYLRNAWLRSAHLLGNVALRQ